ncbi:MAG: hypothetical protein IKG18_01760 [Atopobiaceae bacterium]|nr:hypothetical protein [Atopobiaceae bacterium]
MGLGYDGRCRMEAEDGESAVYSYTGMNANLPREDWDRLESIAGSFTIRKDALEEPEIHVKRVRKPNGRRVIEQKVITHVPSLHDHMRDGGIVVDDLCGADRIEFEGTGNPLPRIVCRLLYAIYKSYMLDGKLPKDEAFIQ